MDNLKLTRLDKFNQFISNLEEKYQCAILLEKKIIANGTLQVTAYAHGKGFGGSDKYIHHVKQSLIPQEILDSIPITKDYSVNNPPCKVCGVRGTELHHWLPQHLSDEANKWPTDYLCRPCHLFWHSIILQHRGPNGHKHN